MRSAREESLTHLMEQGASSTLCGKDVSGLEVSDDLEAADCFKCREAMWVLFLRTRGYGGGEDAMSEDLKEAFTRFVQTRDWIWAKTYAQTAPHEYTVRGRRETPDETALWETVLICIQKYGYWRRYRGHYYRTLRFLDHFYWIMDGRPERSYLVNRCPVGGYPGFPHEDAAA